MPVKDNREQEISLFRSSLKSSSDLLTYTEVYFLSTVRHHRLLINFQLFTTTVGDFERSPKTFLTKLQTVYRLSSHALWGIIICEPRSDVSYEMPNIFAGSFTEYWQAKDPAKPTHVARCTDSSEDQHCSRSISA